MQQIDTEDILVRPLSLAAHHCFLLCSTVYTLCHYDVMGIKVGTKMYMESCTKACKFIFSI